jgi:hypothetical protein
MTGIDEKRNLEKIGRIREETEVLNAEVQRRESVVYEKIAGFLIEKIQSEREKLKDKNKAFYLLGIMLRISELRNQIQLEYFQNLQRTESGVFALRLSDSHKETLKPMLNLVLDFYERLRTELIEKFETEDKSVKNFPKIETPVSDSEKVLIELNICLGQLYGYVLSKMAMMFS